MHTKNDTVRYGRRNDRGSGPRGPGRRENQQEKRMPTTQIAEPMTTNVVDATVVAEAIEVIDRALSQMIKRELVSAGEVSDLLLDVRNLLTSARQ